MLHDKGLREGEVDKLAEDLEQIANKGFSKFCFSIAMICFAIAISWLGMAAVTQAPRGEAWALVVIAGSMACNIILLLREWIPNGR